MHRKQTLTVGADQANLAAIRDAVEHFCEGLGQPAGFSMPVVLSVDEAATNIISHGYNGRPGLIEIVMEAGGDNLSVLLRDTAPPFDPTTVPPPDLTAPLDERPIGGLGMHLIRQNMDSVIYRLTEEGGNELILRRKLVSPPEGASQP